MYSKILLNELTQKHSASPGPDILQAIEPEKLSNLIHTLSHDIGNPMTSIISYSGIIEQCEKLNLSLDKLSPYASKISQEAWKVMKLVDLLLLSASTREASSSFNLEEMKLTLLQRANSRYHIKEVDINLEGFNDKVSVQGNLDQIVILCVEIISNAIGAMTVIKEDLEEEWEIQIICEQSESYTTLNFLNRSPLHKTPLASLFTLGTTEFPKSNKPAGIGLFSLARTISRWGGKVEIQELLDNSQRSYFNTKLCLVKN